MRNRYYYGNPEGGRKAAATNLSNNPDFYRNIGRIGGKISRGGYFSPDYINPDGTTGKDNARTAGAIGGRTSRRTKML